MTTENEVITIDVAAYNAKIEREAIKIAALHPSRNSQMAFTASWQDDTRRYHIWLDAEGAPTSDIHSNALDQKVRDHRMKRLDAKANAWVREALALVIRYGGLTNATRAAKAKYDAEQAAEQAKQRADGQAQMDALWDRGFRPTGYVSGNKED